MTQSAYYFNRRDHCVDTYATLGEMQQVLDRRLIDPTNEEERFLLALQTTMHVTAEAILREGQSWENLALKEVEREKQGSQPGGEVGEPGVQEQEGDVPG